MKIMKIKRRDNDCCVQGSANVGVCSKKWQFLQCFICRKEAIEWRISLTPTRPHNFELSRLEIED